MNAKANEKITLIVVLGLVALGAILTASRIHGFSFSAWHAIIDGSTPDEVFMNAVRSYRSDDWLVALPHALAQRADSPAFPSENRLIGDGHYNMIVSGPAPGRSAVTLFRPQIWGYFISGDIGLAFQWWFGALGIWIVTWLLLLRLTGNARLIAACGATALVFSPFFQAWSLNCAPSVIFAGGTLLTLARLRMIESTPRMLLSAFFFAWFAVAFLLTFNYMPYLVTLLYFIIFIFCGLAATKPTPGTIPPAQRHLNTPIGLRRACIGLAMLVIIGMGAYILASNWDTISIVRNTDYPGQRLSSGGDQTVWHLFRGNALSINPPPDWRYLNPCEGASFFLVFPLVLAVMLRDWWRTRKPPHPLLLWLSGYILLLLIWNLAGLPDILSRWSLMSRAPPFRTMIGLGLADLLLLAVYLASRRQSPPASRTDKLTPWIVCALWIVFHVALAVRLSRYFPDYSLATALIGCLFSMALAPLLYLAPRLVMPAIMLASVLTTYDMNPLARGGTEFVMENPLSQKIRALDQDARRQSRQPIWIAYDSLEIPNLLRMIGAHAINGVHAYPQLDLWRTLDPDAEYRTAYNRYAHVVFELPGNSNDFTIQLAQTDIVAVCLHPDHPRFAALKADYLLCLDRQTNILDKVSSLDRIYSHAGKHIYRVNHSP